jgi:phospholipid/cholesterol/gamma-HCH transport system substrate-binding protein
MIEKCLRSICDGLLFFILKKLPYFGNIKIPIKSTTMSKEFKIGLIALITSVLLYTGFNFLKGTDFFSSTKYYYVVYDNLHGLTKSNPVMMNGLQVGIVKEITILQNKGSKLKLRLKLNIRKDLALGANTKAVLGDNGLLGGKAIILEIGTVDKPLDNGGILKGEIENGLMAQITQKADPLIVKTDSILTKVNYILKAFGETTDDIQQTLANFNAISGSMRNTMSKGEIDAILRNVNNLTVSLNQMQGRFNPIISKMDTFTNHLAQLELQKAVQKANQSLENLNQVLAKVNNGEGTLGSLANDKALYQNLNNASQNTDKLLIDFRENPKRYVNFSVFGKKEENK